MTDLSPELISRYVDGEASPEECRAVRRALKRRPELALEHEDLLFLEEVFGRVSPAGETISEDLRQKLYALSAPPKLEGFQAVAVEAPRPRSGMRYFAAAAALVLCGVLGWVFLAPKRKPVDVYGLRAGGAAFVSTAPLAVRRYPVGSVLAASPGKREFFSLGDGTRVVLEPDAAVRLLDPGEGTLFAVERGSVLVSMLDRGSTRTVSADGFAVRGERARFALTLRGPRVRAAGIGGGGNSEVDVVVSEGVVSVAHEGARQGVAARERVVWRSGEAARRSGAWTDALYVKLLRTFSPGGREILPGYFDTEEGVVAIPLRRWYVERGRLCLVVSDPVAADAANHLVLYVRASKKTPLRATLLRPSAGAGDTVQTSALQTSAAGTHWTVVDVPLKDLWSGRRGTRQVRKDRSHLVRLELAPVHAGATLDLSASLWAARPPASDSEEVQ